LHKHLAHFKSIDEAEEAYGLGIANYEGSSENQVPLQNSLDIIEKIKKLGTAQLEELVIHGLNIMPRERRDSIIKTNLKQELCQEFLLNMDSTERLSSFCDAAFDALTRRKEIKSFTPQFVTKSIKAMENLQENEKPNSLYKLAGILSESLMQLDRMPWGLILYQIDFFFAKHVNEVSKFNLNGYKSLQGQSYFQIKMPKDFLSFVETLDAEFPGRLMTVFRGPMWSECEIEEIGVTQKVFNQLVFQYFVSNNNHFHQAKVNIACNSRSALNRNARISNYTVSPTIQVHHL
jgi:hypothetical protein